MKTVILGAGALGCVMGGLIAEAGYDVTLIGRRKSHTDAIKEKGLSITGIKGTHLVHLKATSNPREIEDAELLMVVGGKVTRSTVLRVALLRGIKALESDYSTKSEDS